jgi:hypothetical protein
MHRIKGEVGSDGAAIRSNDNPSRYRTSRGHPIRNI